MGLSKNFSKYINLRIISLGLNQLLIFLPPLILLPFLTRTLGLEAYGVLAFILAVSALLAILIEWGFNWSITNKISLNKKSKFNLEETFNKTIQCQFYLIIFCFIIFLLIYNIVNIKFYYEFFYVFLILLSQIALPYWLYFGLEQYKSFAGISFISKTISILLIFNFIDGPEDLKNVIIFNNLPLVIIGFVYNLSFMRSIGIKFKIISPRELLAHLNIHFDTFSSKVFVASYTMLVPIVLGVFHGPSLVAIFSIAEKCKGVMQSAMTPFVEFMFTKFSDNSIQEEETPFNFFMFGWLVCTFICSIVFIYAYEIVNLIAGNEFLRASDILKVFSFLPLIIYTSNYFGLIKLFAYDKKQIFNRNLRLVSIFAIFFCMPVIWFEGLMGSVYLVLFAEIAVLFLMIRSYFRYG